MTGNLKVGGRRPFACNLFNLWNKSIARIRLGAPSPFNTPKPPVKAERGCYRLGSPRNLVGPNLHARTLVSAGDLRGAARLLGVTLHQARRRTLQGSGGSTGWSRSFLSSRPGLVLATLGRCWADAGERAPLGGCSGSKDKPRPLG